MIFHFEVQAPAIRPNVPVFSAQRNTLRLPYNTNGQNDIDCYTCSIPGVIAYFIIVFV